MKLGGANKALQRSDTQPDILEYHAEQPLSSDRIDLQPLYSGLHHDLLIPNRISASHDA